MGRRHAALPRARPGALRRRRARADGHVVGFEEKPAKPEERPDPDRRVLPAARRVRGHRPPRAVRPRRVRDHRRPQPLHPGRRAVHPDLRRPLDRRRHGAVAAPGGGARRATTTRPAGSSRRSSARSGDGARRSDGRPPPRHRRRRLHRHEFVRQVLAARRDRDHRPRQADLRRQPGEPRPGRGRSRAQRAGCRFVEGDIADPDARRPAGRERRRRRELRRRVARRPHHPRPRGVPADRGDRRPRAARGGPPGREAGRPVRFLQVSTDEVYGSLEHGRSHGERRRSPRAARTPRRRRPASCSSGRTTSRTDWTRS